MESTELISSIKKVLYNNYVSNLTEFEASLIESKLYNLQKDSFSKNALLKLNKLLDKINKHLKQGTKSNSEFINLLNEFIRTDTKSHRNEVIDQILAFNPKQ